MTKLELKELEQWLRDVEAVKTTQGQRLVCLICGAHQPQEQRCEQYRRRDQQVRLLTKVIQELSEPC